MQILKNTVVQVLENNPHAQGKYQFAVVHALATSKTGEMSLDELVIKMQKFSPQPVNELRSHCVFKKVLAKKGIITKTEDGWKLVGFEELSESDKNEIRNVANSKMREWN